MMDNEQKDNFWDLKSLYIPKNRTQPKIKRDISSIDIQMDSGKTDESKSIPIPPRKDNGTKQPQRLASTGEVYDIENSLIKRVVITPWTGYVKMYDLFDESVKRYYDLTEQDCEYVEFDNFTNIYSSMNKMQFKYYIFWRTNVRCHNYVKTSRSYIYTYVNECISSLLFRNAGDVITDLVDVWYNYRNEFEFIDKYICEIITDICLTKKIRPKPEETRKMQIVFDNLLLPETFFYEDLSNLDFDYITKVTDYSYKDNKSYTLNPAIFDAIVPSLAMYYIKTLLLDENFINNQISSHELKESYSGACVSVKNKRWISCSYISMRKNMDIKKTIIMVIKTCENAIRDSLGIRTKYVISPQLPYDIENEIKEFVLNQNINPMKPEVKEPEYMKFYEKKSFDKADSDRAKIIENEAWETAKILGENFIEDNSEETIVSSKQEEASSFESEYQELYCSLDEKNKLAIKALLYGDINNYCKENGYMKEEIIRQINDASYDLTGDILIEDDKIIDDYIQEIEKYVKEGI